MTDYTHVGDASVYCAIIIMRFLTDFQFGNVAVLRPIIQFMYNSESSFPKMCSQASKYVSYDTWWLNAFVDYQSNVDAPNVVPPP